MIRILLFLLLSSSLAFAQTYTSTIRGTIKDADTGLPLEGASVAVENQVNGVNTSNEGTFRFDKLPVGRYVLSVSYLGYESITIPEILLESGKENVQDIRLHQSGRQLEAATVTTNRPGAFNSVQEITIEQTLRYAATYLDPARVATSFPGVAAANDQANGLVVRGNSPNGMQWRLEGIEIVNPNHLSNAGTFSDRVTTTGGGVNILSTQLLSNSYFMSGAFPAQYGNALSGVLDMNLRKGNDEKTEFVAQVGLIGIDVAAEGPFSKKSKASYLANYRYSFTGLLGAMGVDFGGEVNKFQDFSFNINLPAGKTGTFTVFGLGGISENVFTADRDSVSWEFQKDGRDIIFKNKMGAGGISHTLPLGNRTAWNTTIVASGLTTSRESYDVSISANNRNLTERDEQNKGRISLSTYVTHRINNKNRLKAGLYVTRQNDQISQYRYYGEYKNELDGWLTQPFVNWTSKLTENLTSEIGMHAMISKLSMGVQEGESFSLEPRAAIKWQLDNSQQLSFSYGLHSQLQLPQVYMSNQSTTTFSGNIGLSPTRSHHFVAGYQRNFAKNSSLKVEAYWQHIYDVPVSNGVSNSFSALNVIENDVNRSLTNAGKGRNYGVEATYQKLLTDQYYILLSGSLYSATYQGSDGIRRDSRFNGRHTLSFTGGKEFKSGEQSTWGFNTKILWVGGFRDTPIDVTASAANRLTTYIEDQAFSIKMKDYFRPDIRIYWKKSKTKYNRTLALDIQNISGTKNEAYSYYDTLQKRVVRQYQLGLIPVLSYRWEF
ncbi:TonB-dependent receptor [Dyadobacter sp. CY312]|uniref:TonB-dependent receptor n=1 Tax=Dyadobacter sp. CY312 TaxID=2907303 RepID=UPI001F2D5D67|nr:TonB-dependent receptor [Dyadobacter sp. CY312]MCE7042385.1 TonB-dependent receptor [Dyadobacter sp. CY312]